jgi:hypothetical protein
MPMVESDSTHHRPLKAYNPLDHLRLLGWLLFKPGRLSAYKSSFGDDNVKKVGAWTFSTLCWLPLMMIATGVASGVLTITPSYSSSAPTPVGQLLALGISAFILLSWLLTGWLGMSSGKKYNVIQGAGLLSVMLMGGFCIIGGFAFLISFEITPIIIRGVVNITRGMSLVTLLCVMSLLAFGIPISFATALPHYSGGEEGILFSWMFRVFLWIGAAASCFMDFVLEQTLSALVALLVFSFPLLVTPTLRFLGQKQLSSGVLFTMNALVVASLIASYAMLAWLSYFDGWETIYYMAWS